MQHAQKQLTLWKIFVHIAQRNPKIMLKSFQQRVENSVENVENSVENVEKFSTSEKVFNTMLKTMLKTLMIC